MKFYDRWGKVGSECYCSIRQPDEENYKAILELDFSPLARRIRTDFMAKRRGPTVEYQLTLPCMATLVSQDKSGGPQQTVVVRPADTLQGRPSLLQRVLKVGGMDVEKGLAEVRSEDHKEERQDRASCYRR